MTTIRYFLPEDGDSEAFPNVFLAPKPSQPGLPPLLSQVKSAFPLPGKYHFRFKAPLVPGADREKSALPVWLDCTADNQPVGVWRNTIVAKVTRISVDPEDYDDEDDEDDEFRRHAPPAPAAAPTPPTPAHPPHQSSSAPDLNIFDMPAPAPAPTPTPTAAPPPVATHSASLLDMPGGAPTPTAAPLRRPPSHSTSTTSEGSLLDMGAPTPTNAGSAAPAASADFLGMSSPPQAATPTLRQPPTYQQPPNTPAGTPHAYPAGASPPAGYRPPGQGAPQQHPQQPGRVFDNFSQQQGPFGGLGWNQ